MPSSVATRSAALRNPARLVALRAGSKASQRASSEGSSSAGTSA